MPRRLALAGARGARPAASAVLRSTDVAAGILVLAGLALPGTAYGRIRRAGEPVATFVQKATFGPSSRSASQPPGVLGSPRRRSGTAPGVVIGAIGLFGSPLPVGTGIGQRDQVVAPLRGARARGEGPDAAAAGAVLFGRLRSRRRHSVLPGSVQRGVMDWGAWPRRSRHRHPPPGSSCPVSCFPLGRGARRPCGA
ncbi:hypothetical protein NKG05_07990 [Oerskovia sp. M15]